MVSAAPEVPGVRLACGAAVDTFRPLRMGPEVLRRAAGGPANNPELFLVVTGSERDCLL